MFVSCIVLRGFIQYSTKAEVSQSESTAEIADAVMKKVSFSFCVFEGFSERRPLR